MKIAETRPWFWSERLAQATKFSVERHVISLRREWLAQASLRGNLARFLLESSSKRGIGCLGEKRFRSGGKVSSKRELAEKHCNSFTQVRESSLSEMDILAWAKASSLSENNEDSCSQCLIKLWFATLSKNVLNIVHMIVMLGLKD